MVQLSSFADEALVKLFAEGNNEAFDTLLCRYKSKIFSYIYYTIKDRDLSEDLFQETFIKAITTIKSGRYTENGKFSAWITRIAHNLVIDYYRNERNERTTSSDNDEYDILNDSSLCEGTIEDYIINNQIHNDVRRLIQALPDYQREVLEMRFYRDMSFKEIADATEVSINTALGRMRYALMNMRKLASENNMVLTM